jgi:hypothetical protein
MSDPSAEIALSRQHNLEITGELVERRLEECTPSSSAKKSSVLTWMDATLKKVEVVSRWLDDAIDRQELARAWQLNRDLPRLLAKSKVTWTGTAEDANEWLVDQAKQVFEPALQVLWDSAKNRITPGGPDATQQSMQSLLDVLDDEHPDVLASGYGPVSKSALPQAFRLVASAIRMSPYLSQVTVDEAPPLPTNPENPEAAWAHFTRQLCRQARRLTTVEASLMFGPGDRLPEQCSHAPRQSHRLCGPWSPRWQSSRWTPLRITGPMSSETQRRPSSANAAAAPSLQSQPRSQRSLSSSRTTAATSTCPHILCLNYCSLPSSPPSPQHHHNRHRPWSTRIATSVQLSHATRDGCTLGSWPKLHRASPRLPT